MKMPFTQHSLTFPSRTAVQGHHRLIKTRRSTTAEIAHIGSSYTVQGNSKSPILVPAKSWYANSC